MNVTCLINMAGDQWDIKYRNSRSLTEDFLWKYRLLLELKSIEHKKYVYDYKMTH